MNGRRAKRLRKLALRVCRAVEEPGAVYHTGEVTGRDGEKRRVLRAIQAEYREGSFDRVYRELKKRAQSEV